MKAKKKAVKRSSARSASAAKKAPAKAAPKLITVTLPRIGDVWPGQGGIFKGIIAGEKGQPDYGLILPTDKRTIRSGIYGPKERIDGAQSDYDGMVNTQAMAKAGSELAKQALALKIDGHKDFYIPARHEARLIYVNSPEAIGTGLHWTSTQSRDWAGYAWCQDFENGFQYFYLKATAFPVLLVRRVVIR